MTELEQGWNWFGADSPGEKSDVSVTGNDEDLARTFARCFRGRDGVRAIAYLRAVTLERAFGHNAPDALLRHVEGQRQLVRHIGALIERGRT